MQTIELPKLGESVQEGKVLCWVKLVGDPVQKGEALVEIETDKINMLLESPASGVLRAIFVPEGGSVQIGNIIALVGTADEALPDPASLPGQPVEVRQRCTDRVNKEGRSSLVTIGWLGGLSVLLLALFTLQYRENWIVIVIVGFLLVSSGFFLGITVQRWKNK